MTLDIVDRDSKTTHVFVEEADRRVARVAEQAAYVTAIMVVIDAKILQKRLFVLYSFCRYARTPMLAADRAPHSLLEKQSFNRFERNTVATA